MISSRCPRPMGIMASMALIPVCRGWCTGLRCTTDGAWTSRRRRWDALIGPFPSRGLPSESTTRPRSSSPTPISRTRPVWRTGSPSSMWFASPIMTTPRDSSSRLRTTPVRPPGNSRSSEDMAAGRPLTRATPSAMADTYPTVSFETVGFQPSRFFLSAWVMSCAVMVRSATYRSPIGPAGSHGATRAASGRSRR